MQSHPAQHLDAQQLIVGTTRVDQPITINSRWEEIEEDNVKVLLYPLHLRAMDSQRFDIHGKRSRRPVIRVDTSSLKFGAATVEEDSAVSPSIHAVGPPAPPCSPLEKGETSSSRSSTETAPVAESNDGYAKFTTTMELIRPTPAPLFGGVFLSRAPSPSTGSSRASSSASSRIMDSLNLGVSSLHCFGLGSAFDVELPVSNKFERSIDDMETAAALHASLKIMMQRERVVTSRYSPFQVDESGRRATRLDLEPSGFVEALNSNPLNAS